MNTLKETTIEESYHLHLVEDAVDGDHAVPLRQVQDLLSGVPAAGHTHQASAITDLTEAVEDIVAGLVANTNSVAWSYNDPSGVLRADVRRKTNGGILEDADGLYLDVGTGANQVAAGNHTHAQLHDALTVLDTDAIDLALSGQQLTATIVLASGGGLEVVAGQGLSVTFGTTAGTVAEGDHTHPTDPAVVVGVLDSTSIDFTVGLQLISGQVKRSAAPPDGGARILVAADGLYVETGNSSGVAAAGNHTHSVATTAADGFMSAADKLKLDNLETDYLSESEALAQYVRKDGLAAAQIWIGNNSGVATPRTMSGAATLSSTGVLSLAAAAATDSVIGNRTANTYVANLTGWLDAIVDQFGYFLGNDPDAWIGPVMVDKSLADLHSHISEEGTNPHNTTAADVGLGNVRNVDALALVGCIDEFFADSMTGPIRGPTYIGVNTNSFTSLARVQVVETSTQDVSQSFRHSSTDRFSIGALIGYRLLSGVGVAGDAFARLHTANGSFWTVDSSGNARFRQQTQINGGAGTGFHVHYANGFPAVRGILGHAGNNGGYSSLGGLQLVAQGANQSTLGSGAIHFFTPTGNSAGVSVDATVAARLSILQDGKIGFGISAPTVAFHFVNDGGVIRVPVKSDTGDPSGGDGDIYYNDFTNKFRAYQNGAWTDLIGGGGSAAGSTGELQFNSGSGFGADANLVWDSVNDRLAIGQASADFTLDVAGTVRITGTNALRFGGTGSGDYTASIQSSGSDQLDISNNVNLASGKVLKINGTQMINSAPATGWSNAGTFTPTRGDINSGSITTAQLADRVATLVGDLKTHGLLAS